MSSRTIVESNNYRMAVTDDGTDTGKIIGNMSATLNTDNPSINISASLVHGATLPADSVIQGQLTEFISEIRVQAGNIGLTQFGTETSAN